ncbi:hypothetical protein Krac_2382 [Ktedonobacter racemifer DSM 44963]|uniref:Uncharacterized protein n=2 Tax=Ktedonobacter racemifer TaxID=363277 RepID=D6U566_KTERA|nr:hypothetical protein Krac_2382 [Ktedonobacter racemifer DSM 44963]
MEMPRHFHNPHPFTPDNKKERLQMIELSLTLGWLLLGALLGLLTWLAQPGQRHRDFGWWRMTLLGALLAPISGWGASLLLGRFFATGVVLWLTIAGCLLLPRLVRMQGRQGAQAGTGQHG